MVAAHAEDLDLAQNARSGVPMLVFADHFDRVLLARCQMDGGAHTRVGTRAQVVINEFVMV